MHKTKKNILAFIGVSVPLFAGVCWTQLNHDLYDRFPDLDRKIIRKAFRRMMWKSLTSQLDVEGLSDTQMDDVFLKEYAAVASQQ